MIKKRQIDDFKKKAPTGIKVISVLYYIGAVIYALLGIFMIIGANVVVNSLISSLPNLIGIVTSGVIIGVGIFLLGFGVLSFFIARGLWKLRKWARVLVIIFASLGVLSSLIGIIQDFNFGDLVRIIVHGIILVYIGFSVEVRKAFR
jgi:hypothetical protein